MIEPLTERDQLAARVAVLVDALHGCMGAHWDEHGHADAPPHIQAVRAALESTTGRALAEAVEKALASKKRLDACIAEFGHNADSCCGEYDDAHDTAMIALERAWRGGGG